MGFSGDSLEALQVASQNGQWAVLHQCDAINVEEKIVRQETEAFPQLASAPFEPSTAYLDRVRLEWSLAGRIVVNSDWSRSCLIQGGVDPLRIRVVPLWLSDSELQGQCEVRVLRRRLRVLVLGNISLTKGFQYAIAAAKKLVRAPVCFTFVGALQVALKEADIPVNCTILPRVSRRDVDRVLSEYDVLLFCTLCDGFGRVQIEAMAHGLPVIATRCCGAVVEDGVSGYFVRPRSVDDIVFAIDSILARPSLLTDMSRSALAGISKFSALTVGRQFVESICPEP
jgi:glycosyltransferase involved in cell wall biosynthesis